MTKHNSKKRHEKIEKLEFVQDYLPIRDLKNGIIETTDGRYIRILEIEPINFTLRSDEEQFGIISSFASWLKISPMRLQFKSITRKADSDKHIAMIRQELEIEDNPQCKELGEDYLKLIKDVGSREALTRRFFLIFQYEAVGRNESDDYAKIYGMIQTAEQNARAYFNQCGNSIVQPKDPDEATPGVLSTWIVPPLASTIPFTMARPSPVPSVIDCSSTRVKGAKIESILSFGMPRPESVTEKRTNETRGFAEACSSTFRPILPPSFVNLAALFSRFRSTRFRRVISPVYCV